MKNEIDKIIDELQLITKKVIVESEGNDVLTIQLLGTCKQVFNDMSRSVIEIMKKYDIDDDSQKVHSESLN